MGGRRAGSDRWLPGTQARRAAAVDVDCPIHNRAHCAGGLNVAAISSVFTIGRVAKMLGEDKGWLYELSIDMFPEDGCLHVYGADDDGITAFTQYGIECLTQIIADERDAGRAPPRPDKPQTT